MDAPFKLRATLPFPFSGRYNAHAAVELTRRARLVWEFREMWEPLSELPVGFLPVDFWNF